MALCIYVQICIEGFVLFLCQSVCSDLCVSSKLLITVLHVTSCSGDQRFITNSFPSSGQQKSSDDASLPAVQDLVPILHNQSEYIRHLEAEVKFCKV